LTELYYNPAVDGRGLEGLLNYANTLTNSWFANAFLAMVFIISVYVGGKSEWKMHTVVSFACLISLISSIIMKLFMNVNEYIIFLFAIGLGVSIFRGIISSER
jgi:hypothetical protein